MTSFIVTGDKLTQAVADELKGHLIQNRLTKDHGLLAKLTLDFLPQLQAYGDQRVAAEVKAQQVHSHKLQVALDAEKAFNAQLEAKVERLREVIGCLLVNEKAGRDDLLKMADRSKFSRQLVLNAMENCGGLEESWTRD